VQRGESTTGAGQKAGQRARQGDVELLLQRHQDLQSGYGVDAQIHKLGLGGDLRRFGGPFVWEGRLAAALRSAPRVPRRAGRPGPGPRNAQQAGRWGFSAVRRGRRARASSGCENSTSPTTLRTSSRTSALSFPQRTGGRGGGRGELSRRGVAQHRPCREGTAVRGERSGAPSGRRPRRAFDGAAPACGGVSIQGAERPSCKVPPECIAPCGPTITARTRRNGGARRGPGTGACARAGGRWAWLLSHGRKARRRACIRTDLSVH
jgi:hypothetical protein